MLDFFDTKYVGTVFLEGSTSERAWSWITSSEQQRLQMKETDRLVEGEGVITLVFESERPAFSGF